MDQLSISVPPRLVPQKRAPVPFMAALVPVVAGVVLWLVTGSLYSLCFAALGPLMIFASLIDGARSGRTARRRAGAEHEQAWTDAEEQLRRRHHEERTTRWQRQPDAAGCLRELPLRGTEGPSPSTEVVVGSATGRSALTVSGGDGDRERDFQTRCRAIERVPLTVPLRGGIAVRGPLPTVSAVVRALIVQLCLRFGPGQLALIGTGLEAWGLADFPHAATARRGAFRLAVGSTPDTRSQGDAVILLLPSEAEVPEGITTVIDVVEPMRAALRTPDGTVALACEGLSHTQAVAAAMLRAEAAVELDGLPDAVGLRDIDAKWSETGLPAAIGRGERDAVVLDIVHDGPHAIVTGTTGSGKSELLVSWVTAIAARHGPDRVAFVLVDFKGGTAFEPLRPLPQVTAVITDLDEAGTRRGVSSLTAELRRRESLLAAANARDVSESGMPRLVIVVDEFAALLQEHPDLGVVFTDIAARGRALGMHLIIGTQRASGVIRDALAANCPLRVSLRVSDAADSRLVIGTDAASELEGGAASRGIALARRPQDSEPMMMRIALTAASDLRGICLRWNEAERPRSPWLPPLPEVLPLRDVVEGAPSGAIVLGRADHPTRQEQPLVIVKVGIDRGMSVLGAAGSGRTSLLRLLAAQHADPLWIPSDPEQAWDAVEALAASVAHRPALVLCDDLDARLSDLPAEYAQHLAQRWEQVLRNGAGTTFVLTASRATGPGGRLLDALPLRALLRTSSRVDHLAAGGESAGFDRDRPPGRARLGEREVQIAWVDENRGASDRETASEHEGVTGDRRIRRVRDGAPPAWSPRTPVTGVVTTAAPAMADALALAHPECEVVLVSGATGEPATSGRIILVAEAEVWQRTWPLWQHVRREGEAIIRAENPIDLRQLAQVRELPPYARPHAGRAWSVVGSDSPRRVVLSAFAPG